MFDCVTNKNDVVSDGIKAKRRIPIKGHDDHIALYATIDELERMSLKHEKRRIESFFDLASPSNGR